MIRRYPQDGVFLLPTLDVLGLYFQRAVMLTFWAVNGDNFQCLLSNVENPLILGNDPEMFRSHETPRATPILSGRPLRDHNVVWLPLSESDAVVAIVLQTRNQDRESEDLLAAELESLLSGEHFWREFQEHLAKGISSAPKRWRDVAPPQNASRQANLPRLLDAISHTIEVTQLHRAIKGSTPISATNIVSQFFSHIEEEVDAFFLEKASFKPFHHPGPSGQALFPNLHLCVASAITSEALRKGELPFTARLFFTEVQREAFRAYLSDENAAVHVANLEKHLHDEFSGHNLSADIDRIVEMARSADADALLEYLTHNLQADSTATADNAFTSGSVSFGSSPGRSSDRAKTYPDQLRRMAESVLYGICRPNELDKFIFHIPIHVNGVSWVDAFTFTEQDPAADDRSWTHNYLLYRDIIAEFGSLIRISTQSIYLRLMEELVETAWSLPNGDAADLASELNLQCSRLALTIPFPWIRFSATSNDTALQIPHRRCKTLWVSVIDNPFFVATVNYRRLPVSEVAQRVVRAAKRADDASALEQNRNVAYAAHMVKLPLRAVRSAVGKIGDEVYRLRLCEAVDWLISLEDWLSPMFDPSKLSKNSADRQDMTISEWEGNFEEFNCYLRSQFTELHEAFPPKLRVHSGPTDSETWSFFHPQWKAVIQTMWNNSCEFGKSGSDFDLRLLKRQHKGNYVLFLQLRNEVDISNERMDEQLALTRGANINQLGIATMNLVSKRLLNDPDFEVLHEKEINADGKLCWLATAPIAIKPSPSST